MTTGTPDTAAAEARLEELAPGYLAKVRAAAAALAVDAHGGGSVAVEVAAVREAAEFDLDVPTMSMNPAGSYVKEAVKRATSWYLRYLTVQVAGFARSVTSMGEALATQLERLDRVDADRAGELEALRERVAKLEAAVAAPAVPAARADAASEGSVDAAGRPVAAGGQAAGGQLGAGGR